MPTHYPLLSNLVNAKAIPGELDIIENAADQAIINIFGNLRYRNFVIEHSPDGDTVFYSLILLGKQFKKPIGSKIEVEFFSGASDYAEFPIALEWKFPIYRYISTFEQQSFSASPNAFFDLLLEIFDLTERDFIEGLISVLINDASPYEALVARIKSLLTDYKSGNTNIQDAANEIQTNIDAILGHFNQLEIDLADPSNMSHPFLDEIEAIETTFEKIKTDLTEDFNLFQLAFEALLRDIGTANQVFERLFSLFQTWLGNLTKEDIEDLLIPEFGITLEGMEMSVYFSRDWAIPMREVSGTWEVVPAPAQVSLKVNTGQVAYHTKSGFDIAINNDNTTLTLTRCLIPKLKIQFGFTNFKLDLSEKTNIAEATAEGRPENFRGAYLEEIFVVLPDDWFKFDPDGSTLEIYGKNVLLGTGGLSGKIGVRTVSGMDAKLTFTGVKIKENNTEKEIKFIANPGETEVFFGQEVQYASGGLLAEGKYLLVDGGSIRVDGSNKLEAFLASDGELVYTLKKKGSTSGKGWKIGFNTFYLEFLQNKLIESELKGFLEIPKFKKAVKDASGAWVEQTGEVRIDIEMALEEDGDFAITASVKNGLAMMIPKAFVIEIESLSVGKDDKKAFIKTTGSLYFDNNNLLNKVIEEPIEFKGLKIYSDGTYEIEGGSIPLPRSVPFNIGPLNLQVTSLELGAHEQMHGGNLRKYKYFGFGAALSVNPGGVDMKGEGLKFYYTVDNIGAFHSFLRIESLAIDLIIPGTASPENATLILKGFLALKDPDYEGSIEFIVPKAELAGGANMKYNKKDPSFYVDAWMDLPSPLPLASTGLGIYGFKGMFGMNYTAIKAENETWTDWYRAEPRGVDATKIEKIDPIESAKDAFLIGAGMSLATMADKGKSFSSQLMLLLSIPNLILLEGRANVLGERVGLTGGDPPFYAMLAYSPRESIEIAFGADYYIPEKSKGAVRKGQALEVHADIRAAYFFKDARAWYVNFGTDEKPITAKIGGTFNGYAYLMLAASGMRAGAGIRLGFNKSYFKGAVQASIRAYLDVWARVSFERPQFGGGIALGGGVSVKFLGIGFYISLDTILVLEMAKPFKIHGSVRLCVGVDLKIKKIEKCFTVSFSWEKSKAVDKTPIAPLPESASVSPVQGIHRINNRTYEVNYFANSSPDPSDIDAVIPLDTYLDLQFDKAVDPAALTNIGGFTNSNTYHIERIPPSGSRRIVTHQYSVKSLKIEIADNGSFIDYHPYEALSDSLPTSSNLMLGYWQKVGKEYNKIRIPAQTSFSYTQAGLPSWYVPEQLGLPAKTLFCERKKLVEHCVTFKATTSPNGVPIITDLQAGIQHPYETLVLDIKGQNAQLKQHLEMILDSQLTVHFPESVHSFVICYFSPNITARLTAYKQTISGENLEIVEEKAIYSTLLAPSCDPMKLEVESKDLMKESIDFFTIEIAERKEDTTTSSLKGEIQQLKTELNENPNLTNEDWRRIKEQMAYKEANLTLSNFDYCKRENSTTPSVPNNNDIGKTLADLYDLSEQCRIQVTLLKEQYENCLILAQDAIGLDCKTLLRALHAKQKECEELTRTIRRLEALNVFHFISVCYVTEESYLEQIDTPSQAAIDADYQQMKAAVEYQISPILKPFSTYRVSVEVEDKVNGTPHPFTMYFGFKTEGPIGHFSNDTIKDQKLENNEELNALKYYLNYEKCFPNADGRILYAKPLYYKNPKLLIFFKEAYTYHFFQEWTTYGNEQQYELLIKIKDPTEEGHDRTASSPPEAQVLQALPMAKAPVFLEEADAALPNDVQLLNQLTKNSCLFNDAKPYQPMQPPKKYAAVETEEDLLPSKMYTAVLFNKGGKVGGIPTEAEIHRYGFQTSRYGDFKEQIESYQLIDPKDANNTTKAIFDIDIDFASISLDNSWKIIRGRSIRNAGLETAYPDRFDRLVLGLWKLKALAPAVCTEFNIIRNSVDDSSVALWIRSPEPLNDPKMPLNILESTVLLYRNGNLLSSTRSLFSRDASQVILMMSSRQLLPNDLEVEFIYKQWNGKEYEQIETVNVSLDA